MPEDLHAHAAVQPDPGTEEQIPRAQRHAGHLLWIDSFQLGDISRGISPRSGSRVPYRLKNAGEQLTED
ncbi:MAG: hypothetical protein WKF73_08115 [Nocardioidaceae bacterium]